MARSSYIYVISADHGPTQAFTVKHELISFMRRFPESVAKRTVTRLGDGNLGSSVMSWPAPLYLSENT